MIVLYIHKIYDTVQHSPYGQQAAIFTSDAAAAAPLLDVLSTAVGRVNINTQCGRSPDSLPFSGRRSSALGTMSVMEALKSFSIETVVAGKDLAGNNQILKGFESHGKFLEPLKDATEQQTQEL